MFNCVGMMLMWCFGFYFGGFLRKVYGELLFEVVLLVDFCDCEFGC